MSEEIKPKKERKFLKALGKIGEVLIQELFFRVGSNLIRKIGGKKTLPSILFIFLSLSLFAQFPNTLNKQRLGFQTTADGLVWRGSLGDTASIQPINNQNAWVILDTINLKFYTFDFTSNVWNLVGGAAFAQPVDSLFFNVNVPTNNVDTAKMRWDSDLATVVLGLNDNVPNEIGFKNFWLVKNQTGSTITKGSLVYANGTVGASGRITVAKFIANGSIDAKYLLGITAHDLTDGEDGYVISFGKIRQVNTDTFAAGAILYPSPTVAGVWTDVEPIAPNIDMPIGFCINSSVNNGTIAIRVASGYKLSELHDVAISLPVEKSSLYYSGGLWRDTTAALLVSDTASMLTPYFRDADTTQLNLTSRFAAKLNLSDTLNMLVPYLRKADTTNMLLPYFRDADTTQLNLTSRFAAKLNLSDTLNMLVPYLRKADTTNMLLPYFRDADTTQLNLTSRFAAKINISDTASMLTPYFRDADTTQLNLTSRFAAKQNTLSGTGFVKASGTNITYDNSSYLRTGLADSTYLKLSGGTLTGGLSGTTGTFTGLNVNNTTTEAILNLRSVDFNNASKISFGDGSVARQEIIKPTSTSNLQFRSYPTSSASGGYEFYVSNGSLESLAATIGTDKSFSLTGTLGVTGATTLGSTLAVTGDITENGNNVLTSADTNSMLLPYWRSGNFSGVLPVVNGGTNTSTLTANKIMVGNGTSGVLTPTNLHWDNTNSRLGINRIPGGYALDITGDLRITGELITTENITLGNGASQTGFIINSSGATNQGPVIRLIKAGVTKGYIGVSSGIIGGTSDDLSSYSVNSITFHTKNQSTTKMILDTIGRLGIGQTTPTAVLHLKAGTATASTAPLKFTSGTNLTTAEAGAMEFNGTNLFFSPSTTRHTVNHGLTGSATLNFPSTTTLLSADLTITVTGAADGDVVSLGVPNAAVNANTCYTAWVSAANTVTVRFNNYSSGTVDPVSGLFKVFVTK